MSREAKTGSIHDRGERRRPGRPFGSTPRRRAGLLLAASLWAGAAATRAEAAEPVPGAGDPEPAAHVHGRGSPGGDGEHPRKGRHHLMLMATQGVTDAGAATSSAGLGYEYRLPFQGDLFGVGSMVEIMLAPAVHQMLMATVSIHPTEELSLQVAAGASHLHGDATAAGSSRHSSQAVVRASAGYAFHVGTFMLAPQVNVDAARKPGLAVSAGLCAGFAL